MKLAFPLGLQVSFWLLLNILLLAGLGGGYFFLQGGRGWDALLAGPAGRNLPPVARAAAAEMGDVAPDQRDGVLAVMASPYGATFTLARNDGYILAGPERSLPASVRARLAGPGPREFAPGNPPPRPPEPGGPERGSEAAGRREPGQARGTFLVHDGGDFWLGFRVPFPDPALEQPVPATLLIRARSLRQLLRLLDIAPWLYGATAAFVLSILFWWPFIYRQTRVLRRLTVATGRIAEGQLDTRVGRATPDEFGRLGDSINAMASRLEVLMNGQKRFLGDMAHELCSPLARLEVATGILEAQADPAMRPALADLREEVEEMSALVNELLAFSKAALRPRSLPLEALPLEPLFRAVLEREDFDSQITLELEERLVVAADTALLKRALANLIRNAIRHGAAPRKCTATRLGNIVCVSVSDAGDGVQGAALARLGEPFFRPDDARTREAGGAGMGLAIVKTCVAACGGTISFRNSLPQGFVAEIHLNVAR